MSSRSQTPGHEPFTSVPAPSDPSHLSRGYGSRPNSFYLVADGPGASEYASAPPAGAPVDSSPLGQSLAHPGHFTEDFAASRRDSAAIDGTQPTHGSGELQRTESQMSHSQLLVAPTRGNTLKKKPSLKRGASLKRSSSKRSSYAGSVRSLTLGEKERHHMGASGDGDESNSAFYTPVPTSGNPTEILANRFQAWRKVLKDLVTFFREIQRSYEARSKAMLTAANVVNNTSTPPVFLVSGGIADANGILRDYHKQALIEANKAKEIENDVVMQLNGLRSDLQQKIKEIKSLSGDFKNSVDKELEGTRKAVHNLQEALGFVDSDPASASGKGDPFIVKLGVDRQVEKQIEEENYLHRAYLNLESSGRELESIVVGEIQKAHNAYAGILKREADSAYEAVDRLRNGPIALSKDHEWDAFVEHNDNMVDPRIPLRHVENIHYPGRDHPAAAEVRAGMLERKSKYLKSYTPGWYILSPTHLHEFKSADRIQSQPPVMSLYLPEQKLGSHSQPDSSSHKFMLKGRQTGTMHRGHAWVFRAESHDTMLAWYEDIKNLTEKRGEDRNAFVRRHARSLSAGSHRAGSIGSDSAMDEDEADRTPYSATASMLHGDLEGIDVAQRPSPGGRFPSDIQVTRDLHVPLSPSSGDSLADREVIAAAGGLPGSGVPFVPSGQPVPATQGDTSRAHSTTPSQQVPHGEGAQKTFVSPHAPVRQSSNYGEWMAPAAVGIGGAAAGAATYYHYQQQKEPQQQQQQQPQEATGLNGEPLEKVQSGSNAPIPVTTIAGVGSDPSQEDTLSTVPTSVETGPSTHDDEIAALAAKAASNKSVAEQNAMNGDGVNRPNGSRHQSTTTISDLHIPGQFPPTPTLNSA